MHQRRSDDAPVIFQAVVCGAIQQIPTQLSAVAPYVVVCSMHQRISMYQRRSEDAPSLFM
jgi:hypothetical protein